ncbi:MAG: hypothetical protein RL264_3112 [Bacteroidota bacterium]|jgi:small-conductance mechanosensitive channel
MKVKLTEMEIQLIETVVLLFIIIGLKILLRNYVNGFLTKLDLDLKKKQILHRIVNLFLTLLFITITAAIWNIDRDQLIVFFTSIITVLGIAFVAQWSILTNITASLILFFNHPVKIGQRVRVLDKEYDVQGKLIDISLFFMYIKDNEGHLITIPNSVFIQKTVQTETVPRELEELDK